MRLGKVGILVASEEVLTTKDGFVLTPFPKFKKDNLSTNKKTINIIKKIDFWLIDNALKKAEWKNDKFNELQFGYTLKCMKNKMKPSMSDKDSAECYLFDMC